MTYSILVTSFKNRQALADSPPPTPLNFRYWWSVV